MSAPESWAYLSRVVEGPSHNIQALLQAGYTADQIVEGIRSRAGWIGPLLKETENRFTWDKPEDDIALAAEHGYTLLTPESPGWPAEAIDGSFNRGAAATNENKETLPADAVAPHALWVKGATNLDAMVANSVAVVGTRNPSPDGREATADLVKGLTQLNYTIISGGALGIDSVAHETAMDLGSPTVVVAACGPGLVYPVPNKPLFERVVREGGSIITEYPPGMHAERHRFLTRNRLVAGLTLGTVVVEAAYRSGALNTLKWVDVLGRKAMATPGSIMQQQAVGTNLAIRDERATMVLNATHIHEQLSQVGAVDADYQLQIQYPPSVIQQLSRNELRVFDALPPAGDPGKQAEAIAADAGMTIGLTVHLLMELLKRGVVERDRRLWSRAEIEG